MKKYKVTLAKEDRKELEMYLGMSRYDTNKKEWRGTDESGKLKEINTVHWKSPNKGAANKSGFSAFPDGYRSNGDRNYANSYLAKFWSYSEADKYRAWYRSLYYHHSDINRKDDGKHFGFSVRCARD